MYRWMCSGREASKGGGAVMSGSRSSRRFRDLSSEDAAFVGWVGDGYPAELAPLMTRLVSSGIWTLSVNQGWWPLVKRLDADIAGLAPHYRFAQLSEDLGVLDVHVAEGDVTNDIEDLIWAAQAESTRTCEVCADRAWLYRQGDWLITLCVDHARARGARPARTDGDIAEAVPRLTDREMAFAISAGVPASAFTAAERRKNEAYARASEEADEAEMSSWLSHAEVSRLMGISAADVHQSRKRGALHAGRKGDGRYMYPRWQFDQQNRPLRGLPEVLAAARDEDPFIINSLVTAPSEALEGLSIVQWLTSGRDQGRAAATIHDSEMT